MKDLISDMLSSRFLDASKQSYSVRSWLYGSSFLKIGLTLKDLGDISQGFQTKSTFSLSGGREDPLEKEMATHPVLLPGESCGWRSLVGCSPWGRQELDMTE